MLTDVISGDDYIIRRVPPSGEIDYVKAKPDGTVRPTSASLFLRTGESGLSCSQKKITSPSQLLNQIGQSFSSGWAVAVWKVGDLPAGLEVVATPSQPPELDPGHCEIRPTDGTTFSSKLRSRLAKAGAIVASDP